MTRPPEKRSGDHTPSARLTNEQFELVIRRAAELQARSVEEPGAEGLSEEEALRIGRELGLSGEHMGQALAEVRSGAVPEDGVVARVMGPARFSVSRTVRGDAVRIGKTLERYLIEHEYLVVQRRLRDSTVFVRATGVLATVARATTGMFRKSPLLDLQTLKVSVRQLDPELASVLVSTDLSGERRDNLLGGSAMGGTIGAVVGATLGFGVAPVAAIVALPVFGASVAGFRHAYRGAARKAVVQLESLLDRLEHGELEPTKP